MKRYLILGGTGLVGKSLRNMLSDKAVYFTSRNETGEKNSIVCDILNANDLLNAFRIADPDIVINATNLAGGVDFCENNPELAQSFHLSANMEIGKLAKQYNSKPVLISTDYVFDGTHPPYRENDTPNPLNNYGKFKLAAENWMKENLNDYLIIRTTNVFGWDPDTKTPNFLMGLYFKLRSQQVADVPSYLWGNPTLADNLAEAIKELCEANAKGVYHIVGSSYINRYDWALQFIALLDADKKNIREAATPPVQIVPRPFASNLSTEKFRKEYKTPLLTVEEGLQQVISSMKIIK